MERQAEEWQRVAILRAVAMCIAEDGRRERAHDERPSVSIYEHATPQPSDEMDIRIRVPRAAFWAAVSELRPRNQVEVGRVHQPIRQQDITHARGWDTALSTVYTLAEYVELGYPLLVDRGAEGVPSTSTIEEAVRTITLQVNMHAYDSVAVHLPSSVTPDQVIAPCDK